MEMTTWSMQREAYSDELQNYLGLRACRVFWIWSVFAQMTSFLKWVYSKFTLMLYHVTEGITLLPVFL